MLIIKKAKKQISIYGKLIYVTGLRKWYNPLKYLKSDIYIKIISLRKIFKNGN